MSTFIVEARRVESVLTELLRKKEKEIADFKARLKRKQQSQMLTGVSIKQEKYAKDEFERATSWGRAFSNYLSELRWLNAFALLNRVALKNALFRMQKNYLQIPDNLIDKQLLLRCKTKYCPVMYSQSDFVIMNLQNDLLYFYADLFTGGDIKLARNVVIPKQEIRKYDIARINYAAGVLSTVLLAFIVAHLDKSRATLMINGVPASQQRLILAAYRVAFATNLIVYMLGVCIHVFRAYKINYEFIFGISRQGSIS